MSAPGQELVPLGEPDGAVPLYRRPRVLVVAAVVLVAAVAAVVWALASRGSGGTDAAPVATTTTATATPTPTPTPTATDEAAVPAEPPAEEPAAPPADGAAAAPEAPTTYEPVTEPAVGLDAPATFATGVTARLTALESVAGEARGPGEVSGPAVRVTVELSNGTPSPLRLDAAVVNVYAGEDLVPGEPLSGPGQRPFTGTLAPGASTTAAYVFNVPPALRERLQVTVSYDPRVTTVLFEGAGPAA